MAAYFPECFKSRALRHNEENIGKIETKMNGHVKLRSRLI